MFLFFLSSAPHRNTQAAGEPGLLGAFGLSKLAVEVEGRIGCWMV